MDLMDEKNMKRNIDSHVCERKIWPAILPSVQDLFTKIPHRLQSCLQGLKPLVKNEENIDSTNSITLGEKEAFKTWEVNLERQMQTWRENSYWVDQPPEMKFNVPKGSLGDLNVKFKVGLPPDAVFNIVVDPDSKRVFKNIRVCLHGRTGGGMWYLDSRCSRHMIGDRSKFTLLEPRDGGYVTFGDNSKMKIIGISNVGKSSSTSIEKVLYEVISRRVLVDEGPRQVVEVEQVGIWRFLWWSGTFSVHVLVDQDRRDHTVKFRQGKSGFMKRFEGNWKIEPFFLDDGLCSPYKPESYAEYHSCSGGKGRVGSIVSLNQLIQPDIVPPPPISWYLRGIITRTTELLIQDFLVEALRLRESVMDSAPGQGIWADYDTKVGFRANDSHDIKERWRRRRSNRRHNSSPSRCNNSLIRVTSSELP